MKNEYYSECEMNQLCMRGGIPLQCICEECIRDCAECRETTDTIPRGKGCLFVKDGLYKEYKDADSD